MCAAARLRAVEEPVHGGRPLWAFREAVAARAIAVWRHIDRAGRAALGC
jgi:hypothetical protein